jgi:hypothetical protein
MPGAWLAEDGHVVVEVPTQFAGTVESFGALACSVRRGQKRIGTCSARARWLPNLALRGQGRRLTPALPGLRAAPPAPSSAGRDLNLLQRDLAFPEPGHEDAAAAESELGASIVGPSRPR